MRWLPHSETNARLDFEEVVPLSRWGEGTGVRIYRGVKSVFSVTFRVNAARS
jgi:hypothetical protein